MSRKAVVKTEVWPTGLRITVEGSGSVSGALYGPITGREAKDGFLVTFYVQTIWPLPLPDIKSEYSVTIHPSDVKVKAIQFDRHGDAPDMYHVICILSEAEVGAISALTTSDKRLALTWQPSSDII